MRGWQLAATGQSGDRDGPGTAGDSGASQVWYETRLSPPRGQTATGWGGGVVLVRLRWGFEGKDAEMMKRRRANRFAKHPSSAPLPAA